MLDWLALATYTFVMSITPGPNNVMVMASGANFGFRRTVPHVLGIAIGFSAQVVAVCSGLGTALARHPEVHRVLTWVGLAYMVYLAWRMLRAGRIAGGSSSARPMALWEGVLFQLVNPKAWVMALTTAVVFMPASGDIPKALATIAVVLMLVNIPCVSLWAACGSALRNWLEQGRRRTAFNTLMAALLAVTALAMLRPPSA